MNEFKTHVGTGTKTSGDGPDMRKEEQTVW
jgi:hypothetical protein